MHFITIIKPQQWGTLVTDKIEKDYPLNINITIGLIALANDKGGLCNSISITIVNNNLRIQARQTNTLEIQKTDINWYALSI